MTADIRKQEPHQNTRGSQRGKRMAFMILAGFIIWGGVSMWDLMEKSKTKAEQLASVEKKLAETIQMNEEAKREVARLNDDEYIEQKIRAELHWAKPDETVFYVSK